MNLLSKVSKENKEKEMKLLEAIFECIENNRSMIFNSGAGAGKTYALIEGLKYVIRKHGEVLDRHNQKIICITYTNVAADEVKERLGNTDLVQISTIHERIWNIIKNYQEQLVQIHKEKLIEEIDRLHQNLLDNDKYQALNEQQKIDLRNIMRKPEIRDLFHRNYYARAPVFRSKFNNLITFPNILNNVNSFKELVSNFYKIDDYSQCISNIEEKKSDYKKVQYTSIYNSDRLHNMKISHETLLEYGVKLINDYDILKRIIIDSYPYIFIDEFQDTDIKVVELMRMLDDYSNKINHKFFVGYFGDTVQNIYNDGIGKKIFETHPGLKRINKQFNRRSTKEVIDVINKIRNDDILQESIFEDCAGGSVEFYHGNEENIEYFINKCKDEWGVSLENKLHCLVLTNKLVAKFNNFESIYDAFAKTDYYKRKYSQLNQELLSHELIKLGEIPRLIFNIVNLIISASDKTTQLLEIMGDLKDKEIMLIDIKKLIELLRINRKDTLGESIKSIEESYLGSDNILYKKIINQIFGTENFIIDSFKSKLVESLYGSDLKTDEDIEKANAGIQNILDISIREYELWCNFIKEEYETKEVYHTYHGTKGRQFDNVIIIMENRFGPKYDAIYFSDFFKNYTNPDELSSSEKEMFERTKNLLYVACSRARKKLRIFYIDDINDFKSGITDIFGSLIYI